MSTAGYSGTPLAKKLGYKPGFRAHLVAAPTELQDWLAPLPEGVQFSAKPGAQTDLVHGFFTEAAALAKHLKSLRSTLKPDAVLWVSWPKKSAKVATDITEDTIRGFALASGLVDVKVCAIDDIWSGLKLVIPVKDRAASAAGPALGPKRTTRTAAKPSSAGTARAVKRAAPALQSKGSRRPRGTP